ncbi:MAG: hypothetical protein ACR2KW_06155, partial [Rubrobacter sp.]
ELQLRDNLRDSHSEILTGIRDEGKLSEENEKSLKDVIKKFAENFEPEQSTVQAGAGAGADTSESESSDGESGSSENSNGNSSSGS